VVPRPLDDRALPGAVLERVAGPGRARRRAGPRRDRCGGEGRSARPSKRSTSPKPRSPPIRAIAARSTRASPPIGRLLAASENFWETRWLEDRIRTLERELAEIVTERIRIADLARPVLTESQRARSPPPSACR
jgi:hypothetical protein